MTCIPIERSWVGVRFSARSPRREMKSFKPDPFCFIPLFPREIFLTRGYFPASLEKYHRGDTDHEEERRGGKGSLAYLGSDSIVPSFFESMHLNLLVPNDIGYNGIEGNWSAP